MSGERDQSADTGSSTAERLVESRRIVVKIGSALLIDPETHALRRGWLDALADDLAALRRQGQDVVVVSSGAIAVGREHLGLVGRPLRLEEKQAAAATGQIRLAHAYQETLARHDITVAQILLTLSDTEARRAHLNARATIDQLLTLGVIPVINENDTIATNEIRFGDNDRLAARVAQMIMADTLVLLSDIDGLYTADPRTDTGAKHIPVVRDLTPEIDAMAGRAPPGYSSGGMITKLAAARICLSSGCRMVIAQGQAPHPLRRLAENERCTWFLPSEGPRTARKTWIAGSLAPIGRVIIDDGAAEALNSGKSLLPAGVVGVEGEFRRGDPVAVTTQDGRQIARGLSAYDNADAALIAGHHSRDIESVLGYRGRDVMIHRDDLVLM
ncbi:glutamate 5-kinase [Fodinicurvata sp. EGI_FJ10296]|uniref:glutamate 5-kinase n=1 Tax=Fodinicurvata sp. EGI_FJ10296 TaxID=3231908 RepID=UPI003451B918